MAAETLYLQQEDRASWFVDHDGVPAIVKHEDDVLAYTVNWTDVLPGSETISSASYDGNGVTVDSSSESTPETTMVVSDTDGYVDITVTTSGSRTIVKRFRFLAPPSTGAGLRNDYRYSS
jgi:hypothetical protein